MNAIDANTITIVSGLPRSGTSMMMQFLQAGGMLVLSDETRLADVNNPHGYLEFEAVKSLAKNTHCLALAQGKVVKIIAQLLVHLPEHYHYRIVFMQRDMAEILASQQRMLEIMGKPAVAPAILKKVYTQQLTRVQEQLAGSANIQLLNVPHREMYQQNMLLFEKIQQFCAVDFNLQRAISAIDVALYRAKP